MSPESQNVLPFNPDEGSIPASLELTTDGSGQVVVLLADPAARDSGWAPRVAVALARSWADSGLRIFLMDGDLGDPAIHSLLGENNGEGVTDAVLYGVSPSRMARMQEGGFLFAPAGTAIADPASVLRHPRWSSVLAACRDSESVVVLYLPAGSPGADHLAAEADRLIRLRTALSATAAAPDHGVLVLHPPRAARGEGAPASAGGQDQVASASPHAVSADSAVPAAEGPEDGGTLPAELKDRGEEAPAPAATGAGKAREEPKTSQVRTEGESKGIPGLSPRPVRRRATPWVLLLLIVLVGGVLAALWLGLIHIPGLGPPPAGALAPELPVGSP